MAIDVPQARLGAALHGEREGAMIQGRPRISAGHIPASLFVSGEARRVSSDIGVSGRSDSDIKVSIGDQGVPDHLGSHGNGASKIFQRIR